MDVDAAVTEFHDMFGLPIRAGEHGWYAVREEERKMRRTILREEFNEYLDAEFDKDISGIADALGDMVYVAFGTALTYGLDLNEVVREIHRSNMTKLGEDGHPLYREDGKVVKGPNYTPPNIEAVMWG